MDFNDLSHDEILAHLTRGMPESVSFSLNTTPMEERVFIELYGHMGSDLVFEDVRWLNLATKRAESYEGDITTYPKRSGIKGMGAYFALCVMPDFLRQLDFDMIEFYTGHWGNVFWAQHELPMFWGHKDAADMNDKFFKKCWARMENLEGQCPHLEFMLSALCWSISSANPRAAIEIAACRTYLKPDGDLRGDEQFMHLAEKYGEDKVPAGEYLLFNNDWYGAIDLRDAALLANLRRNALQRYTYKAFA